MPPGRHGLAEPGDTLFTKRLDAFDAISRSPGMGLLDAFSRQALSVIGVERAPHHLPHMTQTLGPGGKPLGERQGGVIKGGVGNDTIDQSPLQRDSGG